MIALPGTRPWFEADDWATRARERGLGPAECALVDAYRRDGFLIVEDERILDGLDVDAIWERLAARFGPASGGRVQDAWHELGAVRAIAVHPAVIALLRMLYGREPIPFQTLNFLNGSEQRTHSDTVHFSSLPSGFMCGVWLALEDVTLRQGPLHYYPGSQLLPEFDYADLGVPPVTGPPSWRNPSTRASYAIYEERIDEIARTNGFGRIELPIKRGSFLIWSANLLHGGSPRDDPALTRKSQVTHYFFSGCVPITPMWSRRDEGRFHVRRVRDAGTHRWRVPTLDETRLFFPAAGGHMRALAPAHGLRAIAAQAIGARAGLPKSPLDGCVIYPVAVARKLIPALREPADPI